MIQDRLAISSTGDLQIMVACRPIGKPRMTQRDTWKKRPCVVRYRDWCDRVRAIVKSNIPKTDDILELNWVACFRPTKSWLKKNKLTLAEAAGMIHRQTPDRDNIDKAVLDCLFNQDSGIGCGTIEKYWGIEDHIVIEIVTSNAKGMQKCSPK